MRSVYAFVVLGLVACSSPGKALDLTMSFDDATVSDASLASIKTIVIHVSGDETATYPIVPGRAVMRTERVVYRYAPASHSLALQIDATDENGVVVAEGMAGPVSISGTRALSVTLSAPGPGSDMGVADLSMGSDLAVPPDLAKFYAYPAFLNATLANTANGSSVTATPPSGTEAGTLLIAMVGGVNATTQTPVSISPPAGWSLLTTVSTADSPPATASWFWRYAVTDEPTSYGFTRGDTGSMVAYVAAYAGTVAPDANGPFEGPTTQSNAADTTAAFPSSTLGTHYTLGVVNGFAPDDLDESWSTPTGLTLRLGAEVISADVQMDSYGTPFSSAASTLSMSSRSLTLAVGLRGIGGP